MRKTDGDRVPGTQKVSSPLYVPPCEPGGGSAKHKTTRILVDADGAIAPRMKHSFVDRQYSPSTGMDHSEWEIILEELTHMGFLVKRESLSESEEG
jgi:hypothetical protein